MDVIVPDDQLSLAIGKKGQNVRLAVQLTRYRIDIKSESHMRQVQADLSEALAAAGEFGDYEAKQLMDHGVASLRELADAEQDLLLAIPGMDTTDSAAAQILGVFGSEFAPFVGRSWEDEYRSSVLPSMTSSIS